MRRTVIDWGVAGALAFLALVTASLIYSNNSRNSRFDADGVSTVAQYVSGETKWVKSNPDRPSRARHYATVYFDVNGARVKVRTRVTGDFLRAHEAGDEVPIRYLRDDPEKILLDPLYESRSLALAWMFLIFFALCLVVPILRRVLPTRKRSGTQVSRPGSRRKAGPLPIWLRIVSGVLMLGTFVSFFTLSVSLRYWVEEVTLPHLGWVSLPLAMVAMLIPPVGFGILNLGLIWLVQRRGF